MFHNQIKKFDVGRTPDGLISFSIFAGKTKGYNTGVGFDSDTSKAEIFCKMLSKATERVKSKKEIGETLIAPFYRKKVKFISREFTVEILVPFNLGWGVEEHAVELNVDEAEALVEKLRHMIDRIKIEENWE